MNIYKDLGEQFDASEAACDAAAESLQGARTHNGGALTQSQDQFKIPLYHYYEQ